MKNHEIFQCRRCGAENIIGTRYCVVCSERYYYNCPHCNTWVDNSFVNCPACQRELHWPVIENPQLYYTGISYQASGKSRSGIAVLACSCLILFVIAFVLISSNSVSAKPVDVSSGASAATASDKIYTADKDNGSQPAITVISATPDTSEPAPPSVTDLIATAGNEVVIIDMNMINEDTSIETYYPYKLTSSYTPKRSAYLESLWPGWGHCTKGTCGGSQ